MSGSSGSASHRFLLALIALLLLGLSLASAVATAATTETNCENLQEALNKAKAGDTITLTQMCTELNSGFREGKFELPKESAFTLTGTPGAGFDGTGVSGPVLSGTELGSLTITGLVFQNDSDSGTSPVNLRAERLTLRNDGFLGNSHEGVTGGALTAYVGPPKPCPAAGTPGVTITGSTFRDNTNTVGGGIGAGGAAFVLDNCTGAGNVLEGNVFEGNALRTNGNRAVGGALLLASESKPGAAVASQVGNVFAGNSIVDVSGSGSYGGGGEWLEGVSLMSVGDRFSGNTIPGTSGPYWSWGAGVGVLACSNTEPTVSALENTVIEGNVIGPGEPADIGGAGVYVGCLASGTANHLSLLDSTVTENSAPAGAVAGVNGGPHDQLRIANSIVAGDVGGAELGGFSGPGGSLVASFSDVCNASAPLAGEGNICANPLLVDNGNPASFDVHETASSPTIDAGSNALVPSGLTADAFGTTRILAGHVGCFQSFPAVVDMGAAEFQSAAPPCLPPRPPARGLTHFVRLKTNAKGAALTLSCSSTSGQGCSGEIFLTTDETRQGKKVIAVGARKRTKRTTVSVRIGQAPFSLPAGSTATFQVRLNSTGLQLLRRFHTISAWVLANETMANNSPVIFLLHSTLFKQPKPKHKSKKHKSRHAKRRH